MVQRLLPEIDVGDRRWRGLCHSWEPPSSQIHAARRHAMLVLTIVASEGNALIFSIDRCRDVVAFRLPVYQTAGGGTVDVQRKP